MKKISVIMPTYNSEGTLEESLKSIRNQDYDQNQIEILVIDGGSTDKTRAIAEKYNCRIINNPRKLPEIAKEIGFLNADGDYAIYLDSDEVFSNLNSISRRIKIFEENKEIKNITSTGMICRKGAPAILRYANYIADPFSNFVYRFNGYNRIEDLCKQYSYEKIDDYYIFDYSGEKMIPLFDAAGNMFDLKYAKELCSQASNTSDFTGNIFENMVFHTKKSAILSDDAVYHIPKLSFKLYLNKMKWRVKNNVFPKVDECVGFSSRTNTSPGIKIRKYLFILYNLFFVLPIMESIILSIKNKDAAFLMHWLISEYVFLCIVFYMIIKILKINIKHETTYGK